MEFIIVALCIVLNAALSSSEMAFVTVRKSQLKEAAKRGKRRAELLLKLRDNPERTLSIIQIGITLVGAIAAAVGGAGADETLSPYLEGRWGLTEGTSEALSIIMVVIPLTYFSVVFGELVPKTLALKNPLFIATWGSYLFSFLDRVLSPAVTVLEWSTRKMISLIAPRKSSTTESDTPDNIELDSLTHIERQYVLNVVDLSKKKVEAIFLPWKDVVRVKNSLSFEEVEKCILYSLHTRLPVTDENDEIVGLLNTREFMALKSANRTDWQAIIRPMIHIQQATPLLNALRLLQEKKSHMAAVLKGIDIQGIITLEDIFEEVVGDIYDEDDDGMVKRILSAGSKRRST